ncbi:MAG: Fatty acid metabolism regulator protein [Syntrophorhabdaceae bacterium PtaU1.Bin034]|nr:MAG: Fatty acid metabolism regulator protein [Syntrophorhabdaceae bacterium PtaU1.Bin034]
MSHRVVENVKERIMEEAIRLFLRNGYKGTRVQDITDAVRVTKGAFYWYFKTKDALLDTIIQEYERVYVDRLITELGQAQGNFIEKYKQLHKITAEFAYRYRDFCVGFMTLAAELTGSRTRHERRIIAVYTKLLSFLEGLIEEGKREGCVRKDVDSEMAAHCLNAIQNGSLLEWYMFHKTIDGASLAKNYRQIVLEGVSAAEWGKDT